MLLQISFFKRKYINLKYLRKLLCLFSNKVEEIMMELLIHLEKDGKI